MQPLTSEQTLLYHRGLLQDRGTIEAEVQQGQYYRRVRQGLRAIPHWRFRLELNGC